nr:MAG TPA: hypothetical protein [Caudoviricetes sp.]
MRLGCSQLRCKITPRCLPLSRMNKTLRQSRKDAL